MLVEVIAAISQDTVGLAAWPTTLAGHWPAVEVFDERDQLGDVVAVAASQSDSERDAVRVDEQMVL